jgi:hypothetical protein
VEQQPRPAPAAGAAAAAAAGAAAPVRSHRPAVEQGPFVVCDSKLLKLKEVRLGSSEIFYLLLYKLKGQQWGAIICFTSFKAGRRWQLAAVQLQLPVASSNTAYNMTYISVCRSRWTKHFSMCGDQIQTI